jgi:Mce-associated membrane protein
VAGIPVRPARILIAALSAALALLVGAGVWIAVQAGGEQGRAADKEAVLLVAGAHVRDLISLDYRTVEADLQRMLSTSTGAARAEYLAGAGKLKSTAAQDKVVRQGVLRATGLVSLTGTKANVLAVSDVEIRSDGSAKPPERGFHRWSIDLDKVGGTWLVSKVVHVL